MILDAFAHIHWWGVLAGTALFALLGGVWFTAVVSKPYARAVGRDTDTPAPASPLFIAGPLVCSLANVLTSAILLSALDVDTVGTAILFGLLTSVGYLTTMAFNIAINPVFARPLLYGLINAPYFTIAGAGAAVLLVLLP
ncbi:DUF1761 domain-containing protein [Streptomyces sp. NPDC005263]|uniref:DUF1761 domain-containing protein n=1 Tax=Streptomyces sp. NPDC005263 TaxID=3364711 RepID=UPI00367593C5